MSRVVLAFKVMMQASKWKIHSVPQIYIDLPHNQFYNKKYQKNGGWVSLMI